MKLKTPRGIWALRLVTIVVLVVVLIVVGTLAYSAYEDVSAVRSELAGGSQQAVGRAVMQGPSEIVTLNITVPNRGLYALNITVTCDYPTSNVVCERTNVVVPAGQEGVLHFKLTVANLAQFVSSSDHRINGTVTAEMQPFAKISVVTDFGGFINTGGA